MLVVEYENKDMRQKMIQGGMLIFLILFSIGGVFQIDYFSLIPAQNQTPFLKEKS
jgi:hypothetical protein